MRIGKFKSSGGGGGTVDETARTMASDANAAALNAQDIANTANDAAANAASSALTANEKIDAIQTSGILLEAALPDMVARRNASNTFAEGTIQQFNTTPANPLIIAGDGDDSNPAVAIINRANNVTRMTIGNNGKIVYDTGITINRDDIEAGPIQLAPNDGIKFYSAGLALAWPLNDLKLVRYTDAELSVQNSSGIDALLRAALLTLGNSSTPMGPPTDAACIYAKTGELYVMDSSGNETILSPHPKDAPEDFYDIGLGADNIDRKANYFLGTITWYHRDRAERKIAGENLTSRIRFVESFADYNLRTKNTLSIIDWDSNQKNIIALQLARIEDQKVRKELWKTANENYEKLSELERKDSKKPSAWTETDLLPLQAKNKPDWLKDE